MTAPFSGGPLQQSDLLGIWESVMDDSYVEPFIAAGDGGGLEAWNQSFAQLARVSQAVDVTMESLFILPWSGQTNPPASGPVQATVQLTLSRTGLLNQPLILAAGITWIDEIAPDWSPTGTQMVDTGLRYFLASDCIFEPGESGPITVTAIAERPGYGYNNPQPGALSYIEQPGTRYYNVDAAITNTLPGLAILQNVRAVTQMTVIDVPHVPIPQNIGQYLTITAGANSGQIARMISYRAPNPGVDGGAVTLEMLFSIHTSNLAAGANGPFVPGELVSIVQSGPTTIGYATFKHVVVEGGIAKLSFVMRTGIIIPTAVLTGISSGATATVDIVYTDASTFVTTSPTTLPSTESWRILDWVIDWGITVTNVASPSGGLAGMLDLLGYERDMPRIAGETDEQYRTRISTIADTVTPNAIKRRLNRLLTNGPYSLAWCFREIGTALFPGAYFGDGQGNGDFFDYDCQYFTGVVDTGFQINEPITQIQTSGVVSTGKLLLRLNGLNTPFVPGRAHDTGRYLGRTVVGVAGTRLGYPFTAGQPIKGVISGQTAAPTTCTGGLGGQYAGNNPMGTFLSNAWRIFVDYLRMRAYFVVSVQRSSAGDFGFAWGSGALGVGGLADYWDVGPMWNNFYDGQSLGAAGVYLSTYHSIDSIRAASVFFEFLPLTGPCV
jgi:hypothetical protein